MGQVLHGSATTTEAIRRAIQNSQESLSSLAKRPEFSGEALRHQSEDRRQVEETDLPSRSADRPEGAEIDRAVARGGSRRRRPPQAYAAASGRLPLCAAADDPEPDPLLIASLPA